MINDDLQIKAVKAAKESLWSKAIEFNLAILQTKPNDIAALNRLGVAYAQNKQPKKAKTTFNRVLKIDHKNSLAVKNLLRLKQQQPQILNIASSQIFVEEPGKTKFINLHRLAGKKVLESLNVGNICDLKVKKRYISVEVDHCYVGALPEDLSFRLTKLMKTGNQYQCYIKSNSHNRCCVYIKEIKRSKRNQGIHSFPLNGLQVGSGLDIKESYQENVPFEVIDLDQEDEKKTTEFTQASTVIT